MVILNMASVAKKDCIVVKLVACICPWKLQMSRIFMSILTKKLAAVMFGMLISSLAWQDGRFTGISHVTGKSGVDFAYMLPTSVTAHRSKLFLSD